ncbi:acyl-CoA dehydrogenase family protein [Pseudomonas sp. RIT-PI-S]|uniref:acyl-CoA dehydrogenase family protein n=1 Tax=Pseudomonas sp. RIT-PI-S TaxID=3035295 RepID=UPI0021DB2AE3|nr:acyl-CoA dehydrogenase family protein [Pseudomonas sp. RIT-PI-S]
MDFNLSQEQQMLQDTAARLVRDLYSFEARAGHAASPLGYSRDFWAQLGALGLTAVPFAEELGGMDGSSVDLMLVMTELGRGLCLEPYLHSVVYAGGLLAQLGSEAQKDRWLAPLAAAEAQLAVAFEEPHSHYLLNHVSTRAEALAEGYRLNGRKAVVIGGHSADAIIVSARTAGGVDDEAGISLFLLDPNAPGVHRRDYPTIDGPKACELTLENVQVTPDQLLGPLGQGFSALRYQQGRAIAAQCAEALGNMQEACNLTLDYLKTRKQFGIPIGKFQVLQHRMVDMHTELQQATSMAILAACTADQPDSAERSRVLANAKFICSRAGRFIAEQAIQLHGGIGMTWEYVLAHHAKRLVMLSHQFGDDDHHLKAYAALMEMA